MNPRPRNHALAALAAALLALCARPGGDARAQFRAEGPAAQVAPAKQAGPPRAEKIDEFGRLYGCDGGARLDNFAHRLSERPDSAGYVVAYDARGRAPLTAHAWGELLLRYLVEYRNIEASRLRLVDAGARAGDDLRVEFWLVPSGAEPPAVPPSGQKRGARPFSGKFDQYFAYDGTQFYDTDGASVGSYHIGVTYSAFNELLRRQPDSQGYVVVYPRRGVYPGYWRSVATREREKLAGERLGAGRLTLVRGGVNEGEREGLRGDEEDHVEQSDRVELWVGPKDRPPVRHRPEKGTLAEAALVASIREYFGDHETVNRWALGNLFETARASPRSTACIIVFPDTAAHAGREKPVDLFRVAASLKEALRKRGIDETRVVLMNGPADEYNARLELWAVPYGAALPDPFAEADAEPAPEAPAPEGPGANSRGVI